MSTTMEDLYPRLEAQVSALVLQCESLKQENKRLRQSMSQLETENAVLITKHQHAVAQIENMIFRLKSVERPI